MEAKKEIRKWGRYLKFEEISLIFGIIGIVGTIGEIFILCFFKERPKEAVILTVSTCCISIVLLVLAGIFFELKTKKMQSILFKYTNKEIKDENCKEILSILDVPIDTVFLQLDAAEKTVEIAAVSKEEDSITIRIVNKSVAEKIFYYPY